MKKSELIQTNKYYSLLTIYKLNLWPWFSSYDSLKRHVRKSIADGNVIYKVISHGEGPGRRYLIKGSTILKLHNKSKTGIIFNHD